MRALVGKSTSSTSGSATRADGAGVIVRNMTGEELWRLARHEIGRRGGARRRYAALLKRAVRAGCIEAEADVAVLQLEGYRDEVGRIIVRANPPAAARGFMRAASAGDPHAAHSLGYCLDVGLGVRRNPRLAMKWYRRAWRAGHATAAANIATMYRDRGMLNRAVSWWTRAMESGVPEEAVEVGYCHQYGIGVRRDLSAAVRCYRRAIRAKNIIEAEREAALYHLAVIELDRRPARRAAAVALLKRASQDDDYPEAMDLLAQLRGGQRPIPCRCRRDRTKSLPGHAPCEIHPRRVRGR